MVCPWPNEGAQEARDFAGQLQTAIAQQQVLAVEKLLERVRTEQRLLNTGSLQLAVAAPGLFCSRSTLC